MKQGKSTRENVRRQIRSHGDCPGCFTSKPSGAKGRSIKPKPSVVEHTSTTEERKARESHGRVGLGGKGMNRNPVVLQAGAREGRREEAWAVMMIDEGRRRRRGKAGETSVDLSKAV